MFYAIIWPNINWKNNMNVPDLGPAHHHWELGVEPGASCVERSHLRWFRHLTRMPPGLLLLEVFQPRVTGRRPRGRPRPSWSLEGWYFSSGPRTPPQEKLESVAGETDIWNTLLSLLTLWPNPRQVDDDGWTSALDRKGSLLFFS